MRAINGPIKKLKQQMRNSHNGLEWADHMKKEGSNWRAWSASRTHGSTAEQRRKEARGEALGHISVWKKTVPWRHSEAETSLYDPMTAAPSCVSVSLSSAPWPINTLAWSLDVGWNKREVGGQRDQWVPGKDGEGRGVAMTIPYSSSGVIYIICWKKSFNLWPHFLCC